MMSLAMIIDQPLKSLPALEERAWPVGFWLCPLALAGSVSDGPMAPPLLVLSWKNPAPSLCQH